MAAPVKNTCPDIDSAIKHLRKAIKDCEYSMKQHDKGSDDYVNYSDIADEIYSVESSLEDLRKDNEYLRTWGNELENELELAASYINDLENKFGIIREIEIPITTKSTINPTP